MTPTAVGRLPDLGFCGQLSPLRHCETDAPDPAGWPTCRPWRPGRRLRLSSEARAYDDRRTPAKVAFVAARSPIAVPSSFQNPGDVHAVSALGPRSPDTGSQLAASIFNAREREAVRSTGKQDALDDERRDATGADHIAGFGGG